MRFTFDEKTAADLVGKLTRDRGRFSRELHRLRGFDFSHLLVVGTLAEVEACSRGASMRLILVSLAAIEARGIPTR